MEMENTEDSLPVAVSHTTLVLRLTDRSGAMEQIASTFANRGVSLSALLGNDGAQSPDGYATILLTFAATPAKCTIIRRVLMRLSRVVSVSEHPAHHPLLRKSALVRFAANVPAPNPPNVLVESVGRDTDTGEDVYALLGSLTDVDTAIADALAQGHLRAVTQTVLAL